MEELSYVLTKNFVVCVAVRFFFFFHCRSFSPCWPLASLIFSPLLWNFHVFLPTKFVSFVLITRSRSFSVTHANVDIENKVEKDSTSLLFFLSNSPGGHAIFRQNHLELLVVSYLLSEIFYICMPVVRSDGRSGVRSRDYQNFSDGWTTKFRWVWAPLVRFARA